VPTIDHINLSVPPEVDGQAGADAEASFLCDILGYEPVVPGPDAARLGDLRWFGASDGTQVHLTVDPEHHPSSRAHTAIRVGDMLDATIQRIKERGGESFAIEFDGDRHVFVNDPAGNLWELIGPPS
jgi:catechol 2,3-dioxygenase-like lactoylglutathione lyase family enzyme